MTVAVLTYCRPADLEVILPTVFAQVDTCAHDVDVLVVDNDPAASASGVLAAYARPGLRSAVETRPGIAAARNRALLECTERDLLLFIDDDETPGPNWLEAMIRQWQDTQPTAVVGPVVSEFIGELDPWIVAGAFFVRRRMPTGTAVGVAATNNLLLDLSAIRRMGLRFDERFGLSGGSDSLFTRQIVRSAGSMVWCDEAVVTDRVPAERMKRSWVLRRSLRMGNSEGRITVHLAGTPIGNLEARTIVIGRAMARMGAGGLRAALGTVGRSQRHQARGARTCARGAGLLLSAFGYTYHEYRRPLTS